jgi:toxin-antitoxin system PIN domain toxin
VILVDANLAIYAYDRSSPRHDAAKRWFETALNGEEEVRFALATLLAFIRITTHPGVFRHPMKASDAISIVKDWLDRPRVKLAEPSDRHWDTLAEIARKGQARGSLLMDAHLAALAIEHGATLASTDRDFTRFPGLRVRDPLTSR